MRTPPSGRATVRTWGGLVVLLVPALLVAMDLSVLFVAAPAIALDLEPTATQWLWMMDVYGFVLAGLLVTMGSLGDRLGRRRLLLAGALLFGTASALLAFAPSSELFIAGRVLLGVAGATLAPSTLSLIRGMFTDPRQRAAAVGAWTVAFTGGAVAGPILGGLLLEFFPWGTVFLINLPLMALLLLTAPFLVPESRDPRGAGFDLPGAGASLVAVLGLVYAAKRVVEYGVEPQGMVALVLGGLFLGLFVVRQRRAAHPLIDLSLFARPAFSTAVGGNAAVSFAAAGMGLLTFTFLQSVHGLSPLFAALWAMPTFATTALGAAAGSLLAPRVRPAPLMATGLAVAAFGFVLIALVEPATPVPMFIGAYGLISLGAGMVGTLANTLILATAPPERAGAAAGVSETSAEFGGALSIAVLGTIATGIYRSRMEGVDGPAGETVTGAVAAAPDLPVEEGVALLDAAFLAYTDGLNIAALAAAAVLASLMVAALVTLRRLPSGVAAPDPHEADPGEDTAATRVAVPGDGA
ncbi:MFS transporter [Nocardiopsis sp. MG754419]|uniref:MFS transporter n=1 Tax=Nocardiopsis sp. MG754419 TaxID=2259865 RepID=UPI001BA8B76D|nr:MFS transporter [Nocardiopsis sp. MG754419]MBR8741735.1 MFS transporter [Nocardiopsis sp. MG754419]